MAIDYSHQQINFVNTIDTLDEEPELIHNYVGSVAPEKVAWIGNPWRYGVP